MSDKVSIPSKPADTGNRVTGPELPSGCVPPNSAEWQAANAKHLEGKGQTACCECTITGKLDEKDTAKTVEELSKATSTATRLAALGKLADGGVEKFSMKDKDGTTRQFRLETEKVGGSTLLHCYGLDEQKEEQVVMRASRSADGTFKQQRNKDDQLVSFTGDTWSRSMSSKSFLVGEVSEQAQNKKSSNSERRTDVSGRGERGNGTEQKRHGTGGDERSVGKVRVSHEGSHANSRKHESHGRERHRGNDDDRRDDRHNDRGRDKGRDRDRDRDGERSHHGDNKRSRFNLGEALGTVARYVAPFLLSALDRNRFSDDCNPYHNQGNYRSDRGCRDFYQSNRSGYDGYFRGQDFQGRQDHCQNDYDRRYGNRNYYERNGHNNRNGHDRHGRNDNQNRRSSNWLSRLIR